MWKNLVQMTLTTKVFFRFTTSYINALQTRCEAQQITLELNICYWKKTNKRLPLYVHWNTMWRSHGAVKIKRTHYWPAPLCRQTVQASAAIFGRRQRKFRRHKQRPQPAERVGPDLSQPVQRRAVRSARCFGRVVEEREERHCQSEIAFFRHGGEC